MKYSKYTVQVIDNHLSLKIIATGRKDSRIHVTDMIAKLFFAAIFFQL